MTIGLRTRRHMRLFVLLGAALLLPRPALAQFVQQGPKLVSTQCRGCFHYEGWSVAISADGNTAIVGGESDDSQGAAWVWIRTGGIWTQQGPKLVGSGATGYASQGVSVSLSADGNTAIVGGPRDNTPAGPCCSNGVGAAWVW